MTSVQALRGNEDCVDKGDQIELILTRLVRLKACGPTAIRAAVARLVDHRVLLLHLAHRRQPRVTSPWVIDQPTQPIRHHHTSRFALS